MTALDCFQTVDMPDLGPSKSDHQRVASVPPHLWPREVREKYTEEYRPVVPLFIPTRPVEIDAEKLLRVVAEHPGEKFEGPGSCVVADGVEVEVLLDCGRLFYVRSGEYVGLTCLEAYCVKLKGAP